MRSTLLALFLMFALSHSAGAATFNTAMYGVDSGTCGAVKTPCRTIWQALANAVPGDTVVVGPGYYGDANHDGDMNDPGDERAPTEDGCDCVVNVIQQVTLRSRDGANATVIDAAGLFSNAVLVTGAAASGTILGGAKNGFTLRGATSAGAFVDFNALSSRVLGNIADSNGGDGIIVVGDGALVTGNRAFDNDGNGFQLNSNNLVASGNAASHNTLDGFLSILVSGVSVQKSVASGNGEVGFHSAVATVDYKSDAALANGLDGFFFDGSGGSVTSSSVMGNGVAVGSNCGVDNDSDTDVTASGNYWGAASGPGTDPADDQCLGGTSTLTVAPFRSKELRVSLKPVR
jgi:hypothetical protein